jgi:hypothetical protein
MLRHLPLGMRFNPLGLAVPEKLLRLIIKVVCGDSWRRIQDCDRLSLSLDPPIGM